MKGLVREAVMDSQEDGHDAGTCKGTIFGLGTKTDFASDDKWSQGALDEEYRRRTLDTKQLAA